MSRWTYLLKYRPPMPGAVPRQGLVEIVDFETKRLVNEVGIAGWGLVVYNRKLSDEEVNEYELAECGQE